MTQSETEKLQLTHNISDIEDYGDGIEMVTYELGPDLEKNRDNIESFVSQKLNAESQESHFDINVAISLFITAYARIHIHSYAKKYDLTIYNMDTDSIVTDKPLPDNDVGNELGQMKLEYVIVKGLHSSPKTYWHLPLFNYFPFLNSDKKKDKDLKPIVKSKGTGKDITFESFEKLLNLETIIYIKEKWFKDRQNSTINVRQVSLKVRGGTNKRRMVIKNGVWIDTEPLYYHEIPKNNNFVISNIQDLLPAPNYKLLPAPNYKLITPSNNTNNENICELNIENEQKDTKIIRLNEVIKEIEKIEYYLDHIGFDKDKKERCLKLYEEIKQLEKETGIKYQVKIGTEWSSQMFNLEDPDLEYLTRSLEDKFKNK
jgi:hypothetical protein